MPYGSLTAGRSLAVSDTYPAVGYQDFVTLRGNTHFNPKAIHINSSSVDAQDLAGYAVVDGFLVGENESHRKLWSIVSRMPIGHAFARIYEAGTTARGIRLLESV